MARKYKYQINSKRGIIKAVERPSGTTSIRESRGAYDPKATYSKGDTVIYGGLYYTATTGQGVPGEGDGWEISGIVSAKAVTLTLKLSKPVLDVSDGAKAVTATATATLGEQDITAGLPADGWRWTWRGKELSGETKSSTTLTDIPLEVGQYPVRVTHKLFGTFVEEQVVRVDVTSKLRAELEEALEGLRKSTGDDQAAMAEVLGKVNKTLTSLQEQVDKEVSNWFYPGPPSPDKEPESEWTTNQDKYRHIGDTYTSVDESGEYMGKSWRYTTEFKWQEIHDTLISKALAVAAKAQTTADGKSTTYYTQPAHYSVGDSWVLSADTTVGGKVYKKGTMLFANSSSDVFVGAHWSDLLKYIDSAKLEADLRASEKKSKEAWEAYAAAKAGKAGEDAVKAAKEYAEAQDAAYEARTKAYTDKIVTDKEQALIAAADAKANLAEKRAKAYADGKITDTEQLAIDKAAAAYKAAVKKAKELDGEIQVGGRNLLIESKIVYGEAISGTVKNGDIIKFGGGAMYYHQAKKGEVYSYSRRGDYNATHFHVGFTHEEPVAGVHVADGYYNSLAKKEDVVKLEGFTMPYDGWIVLYMTNGVSVIDSNRPALLGLNKLERGTVATDWTPAPEDVQSEIDAAKEQATKAQTSTDKLRGYVDGAFRDGVVDGAEAKAIKTYINEVDAQWQSALGAYEKVYTNTLLTGAPKTALLDCKTTLAGKVSDLTQYIATAIGDGRATPAEVDGVNSRYNAYKSALRDFQRALKSAEESIRDAGKTTGGRNLAIMSRMIPGYLAGYLKRTGDVDEFGRKAGDRQYMTVQYGNFHYDPTYYPTEEGATMVWVANSLTAEKDPTVVIHWHNEKKEFISWDYAKWSQPDGVPYKLTAPTGTRYYRVGTSRRPQDVRIKLERGSVATDWTPAPEDVQAEIDAERSARETAVRELESGLADANTSISALKTAKEEIEKGKLSISDLPKNLKWIYDAFHHGETQIEGGLILSKYIGLSNSSDKVTSYISGEDGAGAHMLAAGVSSLADQDAVSYINYDGTAKFGALTIDKDGEVSVVKQTGTPSDPDWIAMHLSHNRITFEKKQKNQPWADVGGSVGWFGIKDGRLLLYSGTGGNYIGDNSQPLLVDGGIDVKGPINNRDSGFLPVVYGMCSFDTSGRIIKEVVHPREKHFRVQKLDTGYYKVILPDIWMPSVMLIGNACADDRKQPLYCSFSIGDYPYNEWYCGVADDSSRNDPKKVSFIVIGME